MQAVNLIPVDLRVGGGSRVGRSGGAVYIVLGGLSVLVAIMGLYVLSVMGMSDKQTQLAVLQTQVQQAQAGAVEDVQPGIVRQQRATATATVLALAQQRLDWGALLEALGRTLPANTSLSALEGSVDGTTGTGTPVAQAPTTPGTAPAPVVQLSGCSPSQNAVAELMPRLRGIPGVTGVQLVSSELQDVTSAAGGTASTAAACVGAAFSIVLSLTPVTAPATAPTTPGAAPATVPSGTAPAATTPPATTTPPSSPTP